MLQDLEDHHNFIEHMYITPITFQLKLIASTDDCSFVNALYSQFDFCGVVKLVFDYVCTGIFEKDAEFKYVKIVSFFYYIIRIKINICCLIFLNLDYRLTSLTTTLWETKYSCSTCGIFILEKFYSNLIFWYALLLYWETRMIIWKCQKVLLMRHW